ncbi:MAG: hypothetical protein Q4D54_03885 [Eubacteriales bacterium]|nr:hypothetical protein [Lachnospiraceae bacterium]MDO5126872.1 hypothetical protein [Eubacteriales bacterium]
MEKAGQSKYGQLFVFLVASIVGCVIANIMIKKEFDLSGLDLSIQTIDATTKKIHSRHFSVLAFARCKQMVILALLIKVFRIEKVIFSILCLFGFVMGILLSAQCYYMGLYGILLIFIAVFPQFILYYLSINMVKRYIHAGGNRELRLKCVACFFVFFVAGLICEMYFSGKIFTYFSQYMVS